MGDQDQAVLFEKDDIDNQIEPGALGFLNASYEDKIQLAKDSIKLHLKNSHPLVFAWSAGKDSSTALDIGLAAIREFKEEGNEPPPFAIIHGDTLLENPEIHRFARTEMIKIRNFIDRYDLPGAVHIAKPSLSGNHMVRLIGGSTIASLPDTDSKCAVDMKVTPMAGLKAKVFKELSGYEKPITIIGTRFDESPVRMKKMLARGESHIDAVEHGSELILSPISMFTLDDVFWHIAKVRNSEIPQNHYSDFEKLVQVYRDGEGGQCMIVAYSDGKARQAGCGSRFGCWSCNKVESDASMENMLEMDEYAYMRPLNAFRQWIRDTHYDPSRRNWLARSVEDGNIKISPNAYSPQHCEEMLKIALTIQVREEEAAAELGIEPRFTILTPDMVLGIDAMWNRYGYRSALRATEILREVYQRGLRVDVPEVETIYKKLPAYQEITVPFEDAHYHDPLSGLRDISMAVIDQESNIEKRGRVYADVMTSEKLEIDQEGAEYFFGFPELGIDYYLDRYSYAAPAAGLHALLRLGVLSINKGGHSEWDRMLRVGNQITRYGIRDVLNDPKELVEQILTAQGLTLDAAAIEGMKGIPEPSMGLFSQMDHRQFNVIQQLEAEAVKRGGSVRLENLDDIGLEGEISYQAKVIQFVLKKKGVLLQEETRLAESRIAMGE